MPILGDIYYEEQGGGRPLLLITGLSGLATSWAAQVPRLAPYFRVITHDHRGTGRSAVSRITYSIEQMAADVVGLMDGLGIERADLIGHSTGGAIVQWLALTEPARVGKAMLSATWCAPDPYFVNSFMLRKDLLARTGPEVYVRMASLVMYPPDWYSANQAAIERLEREAIARFPTAEIMASRIDAICRFDVRSRLGGIHTPTLVVCAEDDRITPVALSRQVAEGIPGAAFRSFAWGGHAAPTLVAEEFAAAALNFLGRG